MSNPPTMSDSSMRPFEWTSVVKDLAAILPLLGTEQCEKHISSALETGFLSAAAAPLSIFGSLGIVKAGFLVLFASIAMPKPSFSPIPLSKSSLASPRQVLGARFLSNAGFQLAGTVAPLIGMDESCKTRYLAETRLLRILEKHIGNIGNISIKWRSAEWTLSLLVFAIAAAPLALIPYVSLRESSADLPWIFPILRIAGSCLAAVCCQVLMQSRVISLMKKRVIFMNMNHLVGSLTAVAYKDKGVIWDESLPAEECLRSLERYLNSRVHATRSASCSNTEKHDTSSSSPPLKNVSVLMESLEPSHQDIKESLDKLCKEHFPNPARDRLVFLTSWIFLLISLPAIAAGYIGCFMLVSDSKGNGPLIWLGLEVALSILRILLWASNPKFDERMEPYFQHSTMSK